MEKEKIPFKDYLVSMLGKKKAHEILSMTSAEKKCKIIIIDGVHAPTGKTVLSRVLEEHGYLTLELYLHKYVWIDTVLKERISDYATIIE